MLFDSHAHLDDKRFANDLDGVLARARAAGVGHIVTVGTDLESCAAAIALSGSRKDLISASVGIHPHDADKVDGDSLKRLSAMARMQGVVAVGESGLDYHYENSRRDAQKELFEFHIELALRLGLPLVVHCREAHEDCLAIIENRKGENLRGVAHCFSGGPAEADRFLALGFDVSFAGTLTFPNARRLREVARIVPLDRVLVETDCPYLAPQPRRGKRNEPAFVAYVVSALADLRGATPDEVGEATGRNARRLFGVGEELVVDGLSEP